MSYAAPIKDMLFVLAELADIAAIAALPGLEDSSLDTAQAVLEEAAKFNAEVVAPLNAPGDREPSHWHDGKVSTPPGFKEAFRQFAEGGWQGVVHPAKFGGQGLARLIATPCIEMLNAANLSFALCALLTDGAIEALLTAGSDELKARYLPKLIAGEWTGTMNLTEPQAGSDLALVRTRAARVTDGVNGADGAHGADGAYRISGTKIFITYGEHDMAGNIVHLVLARTPDAPEGVKGISLFVVPKFLLNDDGTPGARNDVQCVSIEHKLGIRASPTTVLQFGDHGGAIGYLVGEENRGLEYMFIMMNAARFAVGLQGVAISGRAYEKAVAYAKERVQSRPVDGSAKASVTIIHHPDVRRMLATMRALTEGARALAYVAAAHADFAHHAPDEATRAEHLAIYEYLVPIVKGWSTEMSLEVTSLGVQVHGGMGFIEETGAAQLYRDARILPIYEGTTAIQANDLVGRKTVRDGGATARAILAAIDATLVELKNAELKNAGLKDAGLKNAASKNAEPKDANADAGTNADAGFKNAGAAMHRRLSDARDALASVVQFVVDHARRDPNAVYAGSVLYLKLAGIVLSGWQLARALVAAQRLYAQDPAFYGAKIATAHFFADYILPRAGALEAAIVSAKGDAGVLALDENQF